MLKLNVDKINLDEVYSDIDEIFHERVKCFLYDRALVNHHIMEYMDQPAGENLDASLVDFYVGYEAANRGLEQVTVLENEFERILLEGSAEKFGKDLKHYLKNLEDSEDH